MTEVRARAYAPGRGATEAEIAAAESEFGVSFPDSFIQRELGWAEVGGSRIYGLGADVPPSLDLVRANVSERTELRPRLPAHLVALCKNGAGDHYSLDTRRPVDEECRVMLWAHEDGENQRPALEAANFTSWLGEQVRRQAEA